MIINRTLVDTPEKLVKYMDFISYGYKSKRGTIEKMNYSRFGEDYRLQSPDEVMKSKVGVCWDQVEFERDIFENIIKLPFKTFYIEQNNRMSSTHTFLIYYKNGKSYYFEHSYENYKGIHVFNNDISVIQYILLNMRKDNKDTGTKIFEYAKPSYGIGCMEFMDFCCSGKEINIFTGKYIHESINKTYDTSDKFSDVMDVMNSLTLSERHNIAPNECSSHKDSYNDSPNCIYRKVYKNGKDNMGFIELHSFNKGEAYIAVGVKPKYRGKGLSKLMVTDAINSSFVKKEVNRLLWSCFKVNIASNKQARDLNFTLYNSDKYWNEYEYILDESVNESYTIDTLPDILYFSSPNKIDELKGKVFLSPYIGISSMFVIDNKDIKSKNGYSCNLGYKEWGYPNSKLKSPLKKVHITHNIKEVTIKETGKSTGYIYFINAKDIKKDLSLFVTNDPDREVIYNGDKPLDIIKVVPHTLEWECSYDPENEKHHGPAIKNRYSVHESYNTTSSFDDEKDIVNSLSKKEFDYICTGTFRDSPYSIYRKIYKIDNHNAGFIELYSFPDEPEDAYIVFAINKKYRGKNLIDTMIQNALIEVSNNHRIKRLIWKADKTNGKSNYLAKKYNFKKIDSPDTIENEYVLSNKTIKECIVIDKYIPNKTLYHASTEKMSTIKPMGIDFGNRLQDAGWSTFCWDDYESAKGWALYKIIRKEKSLIKSLISKDKFKLEWDSRTSKPMTTKEVLDVVNSKLLGFKGYIYTIKVPINKVSLGNTDTIDEYTIRDEVKPVKTEIFTITKQNISNYLEILSADDIDKYMKDFMNGKYVNNRGFIKSLFINFDYSKEKDREIFMNIHNDYKNGAIKPGDDLTHYFEQTDMGESNENILFLPNKNKNIVTESLFMIPKPITLEIASNNLDEIITTLKKDKKAMNKLDEVDRYTKRKGWKPIHLEELKKMDIFDGLCDHFCEKRSTDGLIKYSFAYKSGLYPTEMVFEEVVWKGKKWINKIILLFKIETNNEKGIQTIMYFSNSIRHVYFNESVIQESKLSSKQRKELPDNIYGIPSERKYPLTDKSHVSQAMRYFNKCDDKYKKQLAINIIKRARELNMGINLASDYYKYAKDEIEELPINETNFLSSLFNKPKEVVNTTVYDVSAEDYIQKYHLKNLNKAKELQPKVIKIISKSYPELLRKKVFEKSYLEDYRDIEVDELDAYIDYKDNISYPLVDWDLWNFTPRARDTDESDKFWRIYENIFNLIKELVKNDKDYIIEDSGDWDGGSICLTYKKTIAKPIQSNYVQENGILVMESSKPERLFKCPFCNERMTRVKLVDHIEDEHEDMIPQDYTAARVVFNYINKKEHGNCVQCGKETQWNDDVWRYDRYCSEKCMKEYVATAKARMVKKYGKAYILDEPDHQQKMLKGRGISGEYKFRDGGVRSYCGTFEKKLLEFLDSESFNAKSIDVQTPGPVIEYEYNGEKHFWITDDYYAPANLVFDVKDGGDNPNTRDMPEYRAKQEAKEAAIIKQGKYNYIRLTNNNFVQLLYILAEIRERLMDDDQTPVVHINEYMSIGSANPVIGMDNTAYVVPCMIGNTLVDLAYCKDSYYKDLYIVDDGKIVKTTKEFLEGMYNLSLYKYNGDDALQIIEDIGENIRANNTVGVNYFYNKFSGKEILSNNQFFFDEAFIKVKDDYEIGAIRQSIVQESFNHQYRETLGKNIYFPIIDHRLKTIKENALKDYDNLEIYQDIDGYFVYDTIKNNRTVSFSELYNIDLDILDILSSM